jgi:uncharacterized protein involved in exopolysaccharide biosynthesis
MDFKELVRHIWRFKWFLLAIPIITVVIVNYKTKDLPRQYQSQALISAGVADQNKSAIPGLPNLDFFKENQQFTNIIEKIKLKKVMSILSYKLIIHDLENPNHQFEPSSKMIDSMSASEKEDALKEFKARLARQETMSLNDPESARLYNIIASKYYDDESINKSLIVAHSDGSDFISVTFTSGNPELAAFVVNTLSEAFLAINDADQDVSQGNSIATLDSVVKQKRALMVSKNDSLSRFKNNSGVLNVEKQSETAYAQIIAAQSKRADALREIQNDQGALAAVESKLKNGDPYANNDHLIADNRRADALRSELSVVNRKKVDDIYNPSALAADNRRLDSLNTLINAEVLKQAGPNTIIDPSAARTALIQQHNDLGVKLAAAKNGISSIDREIASITSSYNKMVPYDANIANYQREADQATKDYVDALNRFNLAQTAQSVGAKVKIAQYGVIGAPEPSKRKVFIIVAGVGSFIFCFAIVVALFFLDGRIKTPYQLARDTGIPVIGSLNLIKNPNDSIRDIWHNEANWDDVAFKNLLRSLRLDIANAMLDDNSKILGITSLAPEEGRSFIATNLAYAFAMTGKLVMLIASETQALENASNVPQLGDNFENFLVRREIHVDHLITTLKKNDNGVSLLEMQNSANVRAGFDLLKNEFDIIIIDINSFRDLNIAKEWLLFTDKSVAVFKAGREMNDRDKELLNQLKTQPGFMGWIMNRVKLTNKAVA